MKDWYIFLRYFVYSIFILIMIPTMTNAQSNNPLFLLGISSNSSISIKGSSNINTFNCTACSPFKHVAIQGTSGKDKSVNLKGSITVPIQNFDCKHKILTKDLRHTLQAKEYPEMTIKFIDLERMPNINGEPDKIKGTVEIELAGKKRQFSILYTISKNNKTIQIIGQRSFTFSDFELKPPKKLGGIIKVKDDFEVSFTLYMQSIK